MNWFKRKNKKIKMEFTTNHVSETVQRKLLRVHLDVNFEYPKDVEVVEALEKVNTTFHMPEGMQILTADIVNVEILGDSDEYTETPNA